MDFYEEDLDSSEFLPSIQNNKGHLKGCTCSECDVSKGEERIAKWLEEHNYTFFREYRIKECRNILPLPFDFAIMSNGKLKVLIEFDGPQHFHEMLGIYKNKLIEIKKHDEIKNVYCKFKGIPLLRISYKNVNRIDEVLEKELSPISLF